MIDAGNSDLAFYGVYLHIWWVILMTKFVTLRFPDKKKFIWAVLTVVTGFALYFGTGLVLYLILKMFGVNF